MGICGEKFAKEKFEVYKLCNDWMKLLTYIYEDKEEKVE